MSDLTCVCSLPKDKILSWFSSYLYSSFYCPESYFLSLNHYWFTQVRVSQFLFKNQHYCDILNSFKFFFFLLKKNIQVFQKLDLCCSGQVPNFMEIALLILPHFQTRFHSFFFPPHLTAFLSIIAIIILFSKSTWTFEKNVLLNP